MAVKRWNGTAWEVYAGNAAADNSRLSLSVIRAAGDLIVGTGNAAVTRIPIGSNGQGLVSNGTTAVWGNPVPSLHASSHAPGGSDEIKGRVSINAQSGTSYTLSLGDEGYARMVTFSNSLPVTVTVPTFSSVAFPVGAQITVAAVGTGQVSVAGASGVTIIGTPGLKLRTKGSVAAIVCIAQNSWLLMGDLSA